MTAMRELLTRPAVSVRPSTTLRQLAQTLAEEQIGAVLVSVLAHDGGQMVGIVSERDLVTAIADGRDLDEHVEEIMVTEPYRVRLDDSVEDAALLMGAKGVRHLPVVGDDGVHGVVSVRDLLAAEVAAAPAGNRADWVADLLAGDESGPRRGSD